MSQTEWEVIEVIKQSLNRHCEHSGQRMLLAPYTRLEFTFRGEKRHQIPDLLAARDLGLPEREAYEVEKLGKAPEVIFEVASPSTVATDLAAKAARYEAIGVEEYFVFDPHHEDADVERRSLPLHLPLIGYSRGAGGAFEPRFSPGGRLESRVFDVALEVHGNRLRVRGPHGRLIPTDSEWAEEQHQRADAERQRADAEHQRADEQRRRAEEAEARIRELESELARLRGQ